MKKVLAIAPYKFLPFFSGGQKFIARFFEQIADRVELTVISVPDNDPALAKNYKIIPILKSSFSRYYDRSLYKKLLRLIELEKINTIIWEHPYYAWLAIKLKKRTGVKTIIHTHNIEYQRFQSMGKWWWPVLKWYEKRFFRKADKIFFITPEDKNFAISKWNIPGSKCIDLPFGVDIDKEPMDREGCRKKIEATHNISSSSKIFFFNGLLDYKPNLDALNVILNEIVPILLKAGLNFKILIAGKNLPPEYDSLKIWTDKNVMYTGFISDIATYYKASDIFLNPVQSGGGIKTKLVESIAYGTTVISTNTGATGIDKAVCGDKLIIVNDNDWSNFAAAIIENSSRVTTTPATYYQKYSWKALADRIAKELS